MNRLEKKYYVAVLLLLAICWNTGVYASTPAGYYQVKISNKTNLSGVPVYLLIKASTLNGNQQCIMSFDLNGLGSCNNITKDADLLDYETVSLDYLPRDASGNTVVYLPQVGSGRIYFSVGQPLDLYYDINTGLVTDPDGFNPRDVNYYTLYDKVEFSYTGNGVWTNPTAVDFFSIPISLTDNNSQTVQSAGLTGSSYSIFKDVQNVFNVYDETSTHEWSKLLLKYTDRSNNTTNLRVMSPGKAMVTNLSGANPFDVNYLSAYINYLWAFYGKHGNALSVDCSELQGILPLSSYIFTGSVDSQNRFVFTNGNPGENVIINQPQDSVPFFGGSGESFNAANNTPNAIIIRELTSAFEVGLLPAPAGTLLNRAYFSANHGSFYNNNSLLSNSGGPWYDLYSKALHGYGTSQPIYTFAYDDALGQDGTLYDSNSSYPGVTVTLHDMSGTVIPNPYSDPNTYTVTLNIPGTSTVIYNGVQVQNNTVETVTSPFHVTFNGQETDIYINPTIVKPNSPLLAGVVVTQSTSNKLAYTISFPAPGATTVPIIPLTTPMPATASSTGPASVPNPGAGSYSVTPLIGTGSVITTASGNALTNNVVYSTTSPLVVSVNGQAATINLQTGLVTGPGSVGVVVSGASQSGGKVSVAFPAYSSGNTPAPAAVPAASPAPSAGSYVVTPLIGTGSVITTSTGSQLSNLSAYSTASPFIVYINGQMASINLQTGQVTGPGAVGVVVSGASQSGGNVSVAFPAYNGGATVQSPASTAPLASSTSGSYSVTPRIGAGSVITTAAGSQLINMNSYSFASPFAVYVNGQLATINLQSGQVTGPGATGVVVSGASQSGGSVYIDFPGR
ncbi:hypothetical protein F6R98_07445 [Candidatus Methylospira mobilis]|uniref:GH64 domain-containing protein n=1 Tax=Candidatus Methylospira mobilis TaxID=1808979 RepID=A0A5Q0BJZ3_9GAMM|nr:beta-1,3-glucanase family protein [Candidatus Methylospira mobilis]QFY42478.1 hypothetical protein F6R98_07445 [Candidatus Methylospira mobilis]WNV04411.1 beta-1,3-glucanase family protein [Candidatus Methylospira mobilis]